MQIKITEGRSKQKKQYLEGIEDFDINDDKANLFLGDTMAEEQRLDQKYQDGFTSLRHGERCPPCPACGGVMEPWDAWLVTGAICSKCGWNMSEGGGAII